MSATSIPQTTEDFIAYARSTHGDKFDYSLTEFTSPTDNVIIVCPQHGRQEVPAGYHLFEFCGCPGCNEELHDWESSPTGKYVARAKEIHGDRYDYSKVVYRGMNERITVVCPQHGEWEPWAGYHIHRQSECPQCRKTANFIHRSRVMHGHGTFDYSETEYKGIKSDVIITCRKHGPFQVRASDHLHRKSGCPECGQQARQGSGRPQMTTEEFIRRARKVHGKRYDYGGAEYTGAHDHLVVRCREHGPFQILPSYHMRGGKCPACARNERAQRRIDRLESKGILAKKSQKG